MAKCSFCGLEHKDCVSGNTKEVRICPECVNTIINYHKNTESRINIQKKIKNKLFLKPYQIVQELDKYIIGQDDAKKTLAVELYNHFKRINNSSNIELRKNNILLLGPSGCGKTELVEQISKILNIPLVIEDATSITSAGYVGLNVESCLSRLYVEADRDLELTQKGIVYIDEIDKISSNKASNVKDIGGECVQQSFLKMIENSVIPVDINKEEQILINTKNILFIFGGAFEHIDEKIKERLNLNNTIGYASNNIENMLTEDELLKKVTSEDIIKFGFIKEFIGRIPIIVTLNKLDKSDLKDILLKTKNSLITEYEHLFNLDGIHIEFTNDAIDYIVDEAVKNGTGARGLRSIFGKQLSNLSYELTKSDIKEYKITKNTLTSKEINILKTKKQRKTNNQKKDSMATNQ